MAELLAHIAKTDGKRLDQSLREHCIHTAEYASEAIGNGKLYYVRFLAGIFHDFGKSQRAYQEYLEKAYRGENVNRGSVIHTFQGCIYLLEKYHCSGSVWEKMTSEIIAYAVGAHHGLFDCVDLDGANGFVHRLEKSRKDIGYEECLKNFFEQVMDEQTLTEYFHEAVEEVRDFFTEVKGFTRKPREVFFQIGLLSRLVLSSVVYGDRRDTGEFMEQRKLKECEISWRERIRYFEGKIQKLDSSTKLNRVRGEISRQCLEFAEKPCGIYRLNVPTGGGKTLAGLRYALAHAEKYKKKRIIFIIPLLSVLDQNAKVIRDYLPEQDEILEHHSNVIQENLTEIDGKKEKDSDVMEEELTGSNSNGEVSQKCLQKSYMRNEGETEALDYYELLTERWSSPIIISTLAQLLEILFSHKMSAVGRMRALCDSVLLIDEVQSLPKRDTILFNMALNFLNCFCNTTIVLSSATQPCFEELKWPLRLSAEPDMVHLTPKQLQLFQRCRIVNRMVPGGMKWEECEQFCKELMAKHASILLIANTKESARIIYEKVKKCSEDGQWEVVHLSTSMCQRHRLDVLDQLTINLKVLQRELENDGKPRRIFCVSTQLMEAGVDLSFEAVVRVIAGVDNVAQAAGRCNRSGEYGHLGTTYLINLKEEKLNLLKEIKNAQISTENVLECLENTEEDSLIGETAARLFYQNLYEEMKSELQYPAEIEGEKYNLAELLAGDIYTDQNRGNSEYCLRQPFKTVGRTFKVFDNETMDVIVPYEAGKDIIAEIKEMDNGYFHMHDLKKQMQKAKAYTISIYRNQMEKLQEYGLVSSVFDGRVWILDKSVYDEGCGLVIFQNQDVTRFII